ncbi:hypothetical protein CsSME_00039851 [Camellia sinensis var. sinensis]
MDGLRFMTGLHGVTSQIAVAGGGLDIRTAALGRSTAAANAISVDKPTISGAAPPRRTGRWGFSFKPPLRSLWPGGVKRNDAIALDDAVLVEEKEQGAVVVGDEEVEAMEGQNQNWVLKILHVKSVWRDKGNEEESRGKKEQEIGGVDDDDDQRSECSGGAENDEGCDVCRVDDDNDDKIEFDRDSFSKLLRRVSLSDARLYARMSYLGNLAYSIPRIKVILFSSNLTFLLCLQYNLFAVLFNLI